MCHSNFCCDWCHNQTSRWHDNYLARAQLSAEAETYQALARVQTAKAVANFGALAVLADGVILARGCLGMAISPDQIAPLQKRLVQSCNLLGKLCVVARVLDSMVDAPRPTRAEATDIANCALDGAVRCCPVEECSMCTVWCVSCPLVFFHVLQCGNAQASCAVIGVVRMSTSLWHCLAAEQCDF